MYKRLPCYYFNVQTEDLKYLTAARFKNCTDTSLSDFKRGMSGHRNKLIWNKT